MPFDRQMRACEPSRPSRTQGAGSALLAWLKPADRKLTHDAARLQRSARVITHPLQGAAALQDTLGSLNDIVTRKALVANGDSLNSHAAAMVEAGEAKTDKLLDQARAAHADFNQVKAFWKS